MTARCHVAALDFLSTQNLDTGLVDRFSRRIGYEVRERRVMFVPAPDPDISPVHRLPEGFKFGDEAVAVRVSTTRDGSPFGAPQRYVYFRTQGEALVYVQRRLREGRARALRKGARSAHL